MKQQSTEQRVRGRLEDFLFRSGIVEFDLSATTDLVNGLGLSSLDGLEFVLDLCEEFAFDFPADFNPFVDDVRNRGQTFRGMVNAVELHLAEKGAPSGKK